MIDPTTSDLFHSYGKLGGGTCLWVSGGLALITLCASFSALLTFKDTCVTHMRVGGLLLQILLATCVCLFESQHIINQSFLTLQSLPGRPAQTLKLKCVDLAAIASFICKYITVCRFFHRETLCCVTVLAQHICYWSSLTIITSSLHHTSYFGSFTTLKSKAHLQHIV